MRYGLKTKDNEFEFLGNITISIGDGLDLDSRFGYDASKRPQSVVRRRLNTSKSMSINIAINRNTATNLFKEIEKYEALSGSTGSLFIDNADFGEWCIKDVSISIAPDCVDIVAGLQVSMNLAEAYKMRKRGKVKINLL